MSNKRGSKKHMTPVGQDFFALGASTSTSTNQPKKRNEPFQSPISMSPKRPKLNSPMSQSMANAASVQPLSMMMQQQSSASPSKIRSWEEKAIVVPPVELKDRILQYDSESDSEEMIERLLCGAVKQLREQKTKPDSCLVFTLLYLAKIRPLFFCSNIIVEAFSSLLRREHLVHFKSKNNSVPVLLINLLYYAFHDENSWPDTFIKLYIEDSLGERIWVDNEYCKGFVDIILASFRTKIPKNLLTASDVSNPNTKHGGLETASTISSMITTSMGSEDSVGEESCSSSASFGYGEHGKDLSTTSANQPITSRYLDNENEIISYVFEVIHENLNRRPALNDISRNMVKLLIATAGVRNVRLLVAQKLEIWFQNVKLTRPAQDLLSTVFLNCDDKDIETLNYLLKMRMKNKPLVSHFIMCFKELLNQNNGTFEILLRILLNNELSGIRHINNIQLISIMFQQNSPDATVIMARFYFSMIYSKDDHLRILRGLLREVVRAMKTEPMNYQLFAISLINESKQFMMSGQEPFDYSLKDKVIAEIVDIVTMNIFLSVNQSVRESYARPERKEIMRNFQSKISTIQSDTISWIWSMIEHHAGPFFDDKKTFIGILKKILLLEPIEYYCKLDNWPSENERMNVYRLTSESIPLLEETVLCILQMAFDPKTPLLPQDVCEVVLTLIHRATINFDGDFKYPVLYINDLRIIQMLFECCAYVHPENTTFPPNYVIPKFALIDSYWKVWVTLVIVAAHLPSTFGQYCWDHFPTFQALIEMAITNNFQFPPKSMDTDDVQNKILQFVHLEKLKIFEFETYLAGKREINETNSYLISSLITLDLTSLPRRPKNQILNEYKQLCTNNPNYRLCHLLCQSRQPDFLLMVIDKQQNHLGSYASSLNWLIDLVETYENNYGLLPVQCLCEFLLKQIADETSSVNVLEVTKLEKAKKKDKRRKLVRLIDYFQNTVHDSSTGQLSPAFQYLARHLSHARSTTRMFAYKAIHAIVSINVEAYMCKLEESHGPPPPLFVEESSEWFQKNLVKYLRSPEQIQSMCIALIAALSVESNPQLICEYLEFIAEHVGQPTEILVFKCSTLVIERPKIAAHIIRYSNNKELKEKFLRSLCKIYKKYLHPLLFPMDSKPNASVFEKIDLNIKYVYLRLNDMLPPVYMNSYIIYGMILLLSYWDLPNDSDANYRYLSNFFLDDKFMPQIFADRELKHVEPLIPKWLALQLLSVNVKQIIRLVMANIKTENFIFFLGSYGLSSIAIECMLEALDKMNAAESRTVKTLNFDRQNLLNMLQTYWSININHGYKFAKNHLNYKSNLDNDNADEDVEMTETHSKKKESKSQDIRMDNKQDISKMFKNKDFKKLTPLTRHLTAELNDSSVKIKKTTKQFLTEFANHVVDISEDIVKGTFNSIFNVIVTSVIKDSRLYGLNSDLNNVKNELESLEFEDGGNIEHTLFWKCFERFQYKEKEKSKKSKTQKKKQQSTTKTSKHLEEFIAKYKNRSSLYPWMDIYMDLSIEMYHRKDLDSENFNSQLQTLIFSRDRPYFLSQLLHKSNFYVLNECIDFILNDHSKLNPTTVLDFLSICIDSPKLWIGREIDPEKVKREDVLNLNSSQIRKLIEYVILEDKIASRIELIMRTCCISNSKTRVVINFLQDFNDESKKKISNELHTRLYLQIPNVELNMKISDEHIKLIQSLPSFMDKITYNLITAFLFMDNNNNNSGGGGGSNEKETEEMLYFEYWHYGLIVAATKHPLLFIRQLPIIPALIWGKVSVVHYDVIKNLNLLKIFNRLLNILNLLRPYLWNKNVNGLEPILNLYMDMFISYYHVPKIKPDKTNHEIFPLIIQFLKFLDDWTKHDPINSNIWIKKHREDLKKLYKAYNKEDKIFKSIISEMPLSDETQKIVNGNHYKTLKTNLKSLTLPNEVLNSTLSDINKLVDKYPCLGETFLDSILLYYTNPFFCDQSFNITLKILQATPNSINFVIGSYVKCLQNESQTVVENALVILPKFILLAQDYRYLILRKVFELAIDGNTQAKKTLIYAFLSLNSQFGS